MRDDDCPIERCITLVKFSIQAIYTVLFCSVYAYFAQFVASRYSFMVKNQCGNIMALSPASGVLQPLQSRRLSCLFTPTEVTHYDAIAIATVVFEGHNVEGSTHRSRIGLGLHGEGTEGGIEVDPIINELVFAHHTQFLLPANTI